MAPNVLPQSETKLHTIVSNTGCTSVGELEIIPKISAVAVCCASASASLFFRSALFRSALAARRRSTGVLAFVVFERRPLMRVRLFAPLRDKVTSSAQSLVPPCGRASQASSLSILTEPHDELA